MTARIAIISIASDLHAELIAHEINSRSSNECYIIESDKVAQGRSLSWATSDLFGETIEIAERSIAVGDLDVVWWRRISDRQQLETSTVTSDERLAIDHSCEAALLGLLLTRFRGKWISHPTATRMAANKLLQLSIARRLGLKVPDTLVSHRYDEVLQFFQKHDGRVIMKVVKGSRFEQVPTQVVTTDHLASSTAIEYIPVMYQEYVKGSKHLRLSCFGDRVFAAELVSNDIDWRFNLQACPTREIATPTELSDQIVSMCKALQLEMGIFDFKINPAGEAIFLEVNPQGQFLFIEGLTGAPLIKRFADFLIAQATESRSSRFVERHHENGKPSDAAYLFEESREAKGESRRP